MNLRRYRDLFLAESREHLGAAFELHSRLETRPDDPEARRELMRHAHSLKGMAATMGYPSMVDLAHAVEDLVGEAGGLDPAKIVDCMPLLAEGLACLGEIVDLVERDEPAELERAHEIARALVETGEPAAASSPAPPGCLPPTHRSSEPDPADDRPEDDPHWRIELLLDDRPAMSAEWTVSILGQLATVGRVVAVDPPRVDLQSGRFEGRLGLVLASRRSRAELEQELRRLSGVQGCGVSAEDPKATQAAENGLERWVRVRASDLDTMLQGMEDLRLAHRRLRGALGSLADPVPQQLERAGLRLKEVHGNLMELRLVPFGSVAARLHQTVRKLGRELDKDVRFSVDGAETRLDRLMLDALIDPLVHIVRNAIDHGLEQRDERLAAGKPGHGQLQVALERQGDRVQIRVSDDGRGICVDEVKATAARRGILDPLEAERLSHEEALLLTMRPGFSTSPAVSRVSGRGIGLDVVHEAVERLGGRVRIVSAAGSGTEIRLELPSRLALIQTLLVRCRDEIYALPLEHVDRAIDLPAGSEGAASEARIDAFGDAVRLEDCIGFEEGQASVRASDRVVLVRTPRHRMGLRVDEIVGRRQLLVQPLRRPLGSRLPYAGAAVMDDGTIALVLDPPALRLR